MLQFSYLCDEVAVVLGTARRSDDPLRTSVKRWVNQACRTIAYAYPWWTRQAEQIVVTTAPYTTGTVTVTEGSTTLTGSGTTFTSGMVGRKFTRSIGGPYYRIGAYVSATQLTLADAYREDTASGASYAIYQDEYDLAATTHTIDDAKIHANRETSAMALVSQRRLDGADFPGTMTGRPSVLALVASTTSGTPRVRMLSIPDDVYRVQLLYTPTWTNLSADGDTPAFPDECEELIIDRALRNAPKIEGSRRVMTEPEFRKALAVAYAASRPVGEMVSRRVGFMGTGGDPRITVNLGGIVT